MMDIEISEMDADGNIRVVSEEEIKERTRNKFFTWITKVGELAGWSREEIAGRLEDPCWFFCFDDGMKPEEALAEAKSKGVV
jgi:hypothetical protein